MIAFLVPLLTWIYNLVRFILTKDEVKQTETKLEVPSLEMNKESTNYEIYNKNYQRPIESMSLIQEELDKESKKKHHRTRFIRWYKTKHTKLSRWKR